MTEHVEQKPRRKTSVYTRPNQADLVHHTGVDQHGEGGASHQLEGRSRKVSFGSTGRPRNISVGSSEGADLIMRNRKHSVGDPDRSRKISTSRRTLSVEERGWGTDSGSITARGASASLPKPNTYRMNPERPFREKAVREVIENVLEDMDDVRYESPSIMAAKARSISDTVKQRVKLIGFDRYKLVCVACLGQKKGQEVQDVGRCLWDATKDGFVSVAYENATLFVVVSVYAVYQE
ncbi:tctex1 domain-containing protein 1-like [Patiria miniata]|uniref:Uncharacterized protein n=1 Tax=Patiria miniata TaxID=46514 RepID=A0A913ZD01_PATMI|nr:tctex1 domain-containing protein 1-like [Patiria miniata]